LPDRIYYRSPLHRKRAFQNRRGCRARSQNSLVISSLSTKTSFSSHPIAPVNIIGARSVNVLSFLELQSTRSWCSKALLLFPLTTLVHDQIPIPQAPQARASRRDLCCAYFYRIAVSFGGRASEGQHFHGRQPRKEPTDGSSAAAFVGLTVT